MQISCVNAHSGKYEILVKFLNSLTCFLVRISYLAVYQKPECFNKSKRTTHRSLLDSLNNIVKLVADVSERFKKYI